MTVYELGAKLRQMYDTPGANKTTMIHLFGIAYGQIMKDYGITPIEVIRAAQMQESYQTEVSKGIRLSQYVNLKDEYLDIF